MTREIEADELDRAADLTQRTTDAAVEDVRRRSRPEQVQNPDGTWPHEDCVDCGEEIGIGRLRLGKVRCIYCQQALERGRSR